MSDDHNNYRPRSPDLATYKPQPPRLGSYDSQTGLPVDYNLIHRASFDASPYFSPQTPQASQSYFPQQLDTAYNPLNFAPFSQSPSSITQSVVQPPPLPRVPTKSLSQPPPGFPDAIGEMPRKRISDDEQDDMYMPQGSTAAGGRAAKKRRPDNATQTTPGRSGLGPSLGIEVKTKFPVARIKRIMQADEDVGKVAQATPTAVCEFCSSLLSCDFSADRRGICSKST
jgi:Dr1-associated corepressor